MHLPHNFWNKVVNIGNLFKRSNPLRSIDIFTHQNNLQVPVIAHVKPISLMILDPVQFDVFMFTKEEK